jgi:DNA-binding CsgD family transcriptional regulator
MEKRDNRSNHYQHLFAESSYSNEMMEAFPNELSLYNRLNPFEYNEELMDLEEQLRKRFWEIVDEELTERQRDVIRLLAEGKTQMEVAKLLNVNQSSITKCVVGGTRILNAKTGGEITIQELVERPREFWALAMGLDHKMHERRIIDAMNNGEQSVFTLRTKRQEITATGNHPFWTKRGWVELSNLKPGDRAGTLVSGKIGWAEIVFIEGAGTETVYDLTVERDHNFVANGFITHNSINGNVDYGKKSEKKGKNKSEKEDKSSPVVYGGSRKKLKKLLQEDPEIQRILQDIMSVREEKW